MNNSLLYSKGFRLTLVIAILIKGREKKSRNVWIAALNVWIYHVIV